MTHSHRGRGGCRARPRDTTARSQEGRKRHVSKRKARCGPRRPSDQLPAQGLDRRSERRSWRSLCRVGTGTRGRKPDVRTNWSVSQIMSTITTKHPFFWRLEQQWAGNKCRRCNVTVGSRTVRIPAPLSIFKLKSEASPASNKDWLMFLINNVNVKMVQVPLFSGHKTDVLNDNLD